MYRKILLLVISFIMLAFAGLYIMAVPLLKPFPKPSGQFQVGSHRMAFTDESRMEIFDESKKGKRSVVVRFWYPADISKDDVPYYWLGEKLPVVAKLFSQKYSLPLWLSNILLKDIPTYSYTHAAISQAQSKYPVLIFSHGLFGFNVYTVLCNELASHGYIVAEIDHPYLNFATILDYGTVVTSEKLSQHFEKLSVAEKDQFLVKAIDLYRADIAFIVEQLIKLNNKVDSPFYSRLDLARLGILGHSAGGTAAIEVARVDKRFKAGADLDGWYDNIISTNGFNTPFLFLFAQKEWEPEEPTDKYLKKRGLTREQWWKRFRTSLEHTKELCKNMPNCTRILIPRGSHGDFGDPLELRWPFGAWDISKLHKRIKEIQTYLIAFFDTYLK